MLEKAFVTFLDMSVKAGLVILVVMLVRLLLRRMPKIFSYCLWTVVLLRLLCPALITLPWQVVPSVPSVAESYTPGQFSVSVSNTGTLEFTPLPDSRLPVKSPGVLTPLDIPQQEPAARPDFTTALVLVGQYAWLAGIAVMAVVSVCGYRKLRKKLREAVRVEKNIYAVDRLETPFVMGLLRPKIFIPSELTGTDRDYVLRHERHHIRRMDHAVKALSFAALCLHWFNPLVWIAFVLSGRDMEMSCDEAVTRKLDPDSRAEYSALLLRFSTGRTTVAGAPLAFGEGDAGRRIRNLSRWKKPLLWTVAAAVVLCAAVAVVCVLDAGPKEEAGVQIYSRGYDGAVRVVFDDREGPYEAEREILFRMEEFPDVLFRCDDMGLKAEKSGRSRTLLVGLPIHNLYLADLNGDGNRELCATVSVGSGFVDERIVLYDYADRLQFQLQGRFEYDYYLTCQGGKLLANREPWEYSGENAVSEGPIQGTLRLQNRELTMICADREIPGQRSSTWFHADTLRQAQEDAMKYVNGDHSGYLIYDCPVVDYYLKLYTKELEQVIEYNRNQTVSLRLDQTDGNKEIVGNLLLLDSLARCKDCVYYDCAVPDRLFICSEYRDLGFEYIEDYYQALQTGTARPHTETWVYELDTTAIRPWQQDKG